MTKNVLLISILSLTTLACAAGPDDEMGPPVMQPTGGTGGNPNPTPTPSGDLRWAKAGKVDQLLINGRFCKNTTATLVGDCRVEGITWTSGKRVTKNADGWFEIDRTGGAEECHVNLSDCGNEPIIQSDNTVCGGSWGDMGCEGQPSAPGTGKGGGYAWCGNYLGGPYTCNIAFRWNSGSVPDFFGSHALKTPNAP